MPEEQYKSKNNIVNEILSQYWAVIRNSDIENLDLINLFFHPLREKLNEGQYDYNIVKAVFSATNLLDLKVQALLDKTLQKRRKILDDPLENRDEIYADALTLVKPIQSLPKPLLPSDITKAYVELVVHKKKRRIYVGDPHRMSYDPIEIEPISIEEDKDKLLGQIKTLKNSSIDFPKLLTKRTWDEAVKILGILLHLAHEGKIKLHQENFPQGKILISYVEGKN